MICVTLSGLTFPQICEFLDRPDVEMAEVRLDTCPLTIDEIKELFSQTDTPLIATDRGAQTTDRLAAAIESGARYADLDVLAPARQSHSIQRLCTRSGVELIRSYHDFTSAPDTSYLQEIVERCLRYGADVVKIAVRADSAEDAERVLSLYDLPLSDGNKPERGTLVAFTMGESTRFTRTACLSKGAPFTYCAPDSENRVADGQWTLEEINASVYKDHKPYVRTGLRMPSSKSFAQRAILAAALAEGTSVLRHYTPCGDSEAAIKVAETFGARVVREGDVLTVTGIGPDIPEPGKISAGESGLLARLVIPLLSVHNEGSFTVEGEKTLLRRPLSGAADIMAAFGVVLTPLNPTGDREVRIPLEVRGSLIGGNAEVSGLGGSQLISGLLMALPLCDKPTELLVSDPRSIPYMYITLDVLRRFGIAVRAEMEGNAEMLELQDWSYCSGITFKVPGRCRYKAAEIDLESDWSSAAPFLAAGALFGSVEIDGLDTSSVQADIGIIDILVEAGACVSSDEDGRVYVRKAPLEAFDTDLSHSPDLFPTVAVLAAFCDGESHISGACRLSGKESDRAASIIGFLTGMGVEAFMDRDIITVKGENPASRLVSGRCLKGGKYSSFGDHRIAMALSLASLGASEPVVIDDVECLGKSFPDFLRIF